MLRLFRVRCTALPSGFSGGTTVFTKTLSREPVSHKRMVHGANLQYRTRRTGLTRSILTFGGVRFDDAFFGPFVAEKRIQRQ